jgi:hypothetical protein
MRKVLATTLVALYVWAFSADSAAAVSALIRLGSAPAHPVCAITAPGDPCQCPMDKGRGGHCCCRRGHGEADAKENCAKLRSCGAAGSDALVGPPTLGPHAASRGWEIPPRPEGSSRVTLVLQTLEASRRPPDKVPI